MSRDELAIAIAALARGDSRRRPWFSTENTWRFLMVLDEQLLAEALLWSWVVLVLWATGPTHE